MWAVLGALVANGLITLRDDLATDDIEQTSKR